jgi:serine/threonine protein kinase
MFFAKDSDHPFAPSRIAPANGTVYAAVDSVQGDILTNVCGKLEMVEIAEIIQSLAYAVKALHDDGKLHLDIKPSNIFLTNRNSPESKRIALFDFDTVTPISELAEADIAASDGWSPYEQVNLQRERISYATDIYSIGAVFYWLISGGEKVSEDVLGAIKRGNFGFIDSFAVLESKDSPRKYVSMFLSTTLNREPAKRAQHVNVLLSKDEQV